MKGGGEEEEEKKEKEVRIDVSSGTNRETASTRMISR